MYGLDGELIVRIKRFSISNYRSIKSTPRIPVDTNLTIVGPNNEGKSNVVRALVTSLRILEEHAERLPVIGRGVLGGLKSNRLREPAYDWVSDCHISLREKHDATTSFYLEFQLNDSDVDEFSQVIGSAINGFLPIRIDIDRSGIPAFEVMKQGKGKAALQQKSVQIARFIGSKLSINHIPAVRTADEAIQAVSVLASSSLRQAQRHPEYRDALATIDRIQQPIIEELESQLSSSLNRFLPSIKSVGLGITSSSAARALRSVDISIDDGQATPLRHKGDGVISLVGMALLARLRESSGASFNTILAIEEPESHLHPKAIHSIRHVLDNISDDYQVIVTTHSPVLVDRLHISSNIIVENSQARIAQDISEVREALGVRVSDNLSHARLVIVCEGVGDETSLKTVLCEISTQLREALRAAEISFFPLEGSGNLSYVSNMLQQSISEPVCFLDNDSAGQMAAAKAVKDGLLTDDDTVFASVLGKSESELEDLVQDEILDSAIAGRFKINLNNIPANCRKQKFSSRCRAAFAAGGRIWNDSAKAEAKLVVGQAIAERGLAAFAADRRGPLERLKELLEDRLRP